MQCAGNRGHRDADSHEFFGLILYKRHHPEIEQRDKHLNILINLSLRHLRIIEEGRISLVDQLKNSSCRVVRISILAGVQFAYLQMIFLFDNICNAQVLLRHFIGNKQFALHPVGAFLHP